MSPPAESQIATLEKFIAGWKAWNPEQWLETFDDDFLLITMPYAMKIPPQNKAGVTRVLPHQVELVKNYELSIHQVLHDYEKNKAAVYATSKGDTEFGPWAMEYSVFITFNATGDKVAKVEEMMDSAVMKDFGPKFGKYVQEKLATSGTA